MKSGFSDTLSVNGTPVKRELLTQIMEDLKFIKKKKDGPRLLNYLCHENSKLWDRSPFASIIEFMGWEVKDFHSIYTITYTAWNSDSETLKFPVTKVEVGGELYFWEDIDKAMRAAIEMANNGNYLAVSRVRDEEPYYSDILLLHDKGFTLEDLPLIFKFYQQYIRDDGTILWSSESSEQDGGEYVF